MTFHSLPSPDPLPELHNNPIKFNWIPFYEKMLNIIIYNVMCNTLEGNFNVINNSIKVYLYIWILLLRKNVKYSELMTTQQFSLLHNFLDPAAPFGGF